MGKPRDERSKALFRAALEEIIDMGHALVRLAQEIDWAFLDQRTLRCHYSRDGASFTWAGFDEMDEVSGEGSADIADNRMLEGEISFLDGDEAQFKARKE